MRIPYSRDAYRTQSKPLSLSDPYITFPQDTGANETDGEVSTHEALRRVVVTKTGNAPGRGSFSIFLRLFALPSYEGSSHAAYG
ncbi:hypothetical protein SDC9_209952 [bioreactor metagenome]|uniref:Uncharacterized protein n=1 Tax=bioreactor metagenome TaxID=1076179 RepID=A0A645JEU3_9ZZZZ